MAMLSSSSSGKKEIFHTKIQPNQTKINNDDGHMSQKIEMREREKKKE